MPDSHKSLKACGTLSIRRFNHLFHGSICIYRSLTEIGSTWKAFKRRKLFFLESRGCRKDRSQYSHYWLTVLALSENTHVSVLYGFDSQSVIPVIFAVSSHEIDSNFATISTAHSSGPSGSSPSPAVCLRQGLDHHYTNVSITNLIQTSPIFGGKRDRWRITLAYLFGMNRVMIISGTENASAAILIYLHYKDQYIGFPGRKNADRPTQSYRSTRRNNIVSILCAGREKERKRKQTDQPR